ncbi:MAG TPA: inositol 2-dehydrogenase [Woeseiaceae bacterium]|nr:inositol 2-dehydrogenase [Woeseiaceae bacterium]
MTRGTIGIAVIGAGRIGQIHAGNVARHPGANVRFVVDVNAAAARRLADECSAEVGDAATALADPDVQGVVIASSTDTHLPLIEAAAAAGKAVFCEKPLDLETARAERCREVAAAAGIPLFVGFNRRYDPSFRRMRDDIARGAIGHIEMVTVTSRDPAPPPKAYLERSGGLFRDMMIHDFDMVRWLTGAEPRSVFAAGTALFSADAGALGDVDTAAVVVEMDNGAWCQISNSRRCVYGYDQRIEAFGAEGMLRAANATETRVELATAQGFLTEPALPFFLERYEVAYRREIDDFVRALSGETHALAGAVDGVRALELADAAEASRRSGRAEAVGR